MTNHGPGLTVPAHPAHDRLLIAALAAGDLAGRELERAEALVRTCTDCRTLRADLRGIAMAARTLPPAPSPPGLDVRVTPERAAALARGGLWRRLLRPFGRSGSGAIRPLAATFTTLGVAGLLLAALPMLPLAGGAASLPGAPDTQETRAAAYATGAPEAAPPGDAPSAQPVDDGAIGAAEGSPSIEVKSSGAPDAPAGQGTGGQGAPDGGSGPGRDAADFQGPGGPMPIALVSLGFLGAGLGLFLLRRAALRHR